MKNHPSIIIAGAGGIAEALGLILAEWAEKAPQLWIGNRTLGKAEKVARWIKEGATRDVEAHAFHLPEGEDYPGEAAAIFREGGVLVDCLPGKEAPRMARLALKYNMHYINLTEHLRETDEISAMAEGAEKAFVLQAGLAPGYIDILANGMFQDFCNRHQVNKADKIEMRVGALARHAAAPSYYGFTWSPVGVATEYVEPAIVVRNFEKKTVPPLSERRLLRINGTALEEDLTSGGAADLPEALAGRVKDLDYKTLRYPGHYEWISRQLASIQATGQERINELQKRMEAAIPFVEDDLVFVYAAVQGKDKNGLLRREEKAFEIHPQRVGRHLLRAIQTTTAAPPAEIVLQLLENRYRGVVLQSMIDPEEFLKGKIVQKVFRNRKEELAEVVEAAGAW
ncbi:MAG: saccharopine dehydrogenase NADP-binding domain-containing protein [Phaeodactylibacter sp.]|nr:saccharopine dehydrogenase NADP-binding domain-containing protein [Phaeodactylibacter sp.]